jgi:hypothetical protein
VPGWLVGHKRDGADSQAQHCNPHEHPEPLK